MIRIDRDGETLRVSADPPRTVPATGGNLRALIRQYVRSPLTISSDCAELLTQLEPTPPDEDLTIPGALTQPWRHQREALRYIQHRQGSLLAMHMGTGKSAVVCYTIAMSNYQRTLILCPKSVVSVWPGQVATHIGAGYRVLALDEGSTTKRAAALHAALRGNGPLIVVINYDAARTSSIAEQLVEQSWDLVVVDESHKIADAQTSINKLCCSLDATKRLALTGTPMRQTPLDVFGQFQFLDPSVFGKFYLGFRDKYALMGGYEGRQVIGLHPQYERDFMERYHRVAFEVDSSVLDLPPIQHVTIPVLLGTQARVVYDELNEEFEAAFEDESITAVNGGVKLLRLQQITGGDLKTDTGKHIGIDQAKYNALCDLFDGLPRDEPVVVFARFTYDLNAIKLAAAAGKRRYAELSGQENQLKSWKSGDANVLGVQIQSGGAGIDLTRAATAVYYSKGHSLTDYEQSLARLHRPGQTRHVTYYHLQAAHTIDVHVDEALHNRKEVISSLKQRYQANKQRTA